MVQVPEQDGFKVGVSQLPGVRAQAPQVADAGTGMTAAGKQAFDTGSDIVRMQLQMAAEANAVIHDQAMSELKNFELELRNSREMGYKNLLGRNALERPDGVSLVDEYDALFEQKRQEILGNLKNDAQRQAFTASAQGLRNSFRAEVSGHMQREHQSFIRETVGSNLAAAANAFALADSAEEEESAGGRVLANLRQLQSINGWDDATLTMKAREVVSGGVGKRVDYLIDSGRTEDALALLNKYEGHMDAGMVLNLRSRAQQVFDDEMGTEIGEAWARSVLGAGDGQDVAVGGKGVSADMVEPVKYTRISSGFGMRLHPVDKVYRQHTGIDYAAPLNTLVVAVADGEIILKDNKGGYGKTVMIRHADGKETLYAHLNGFAQIGRRVKAGQVIGYVGSTGKSTGPHLHYEVRINGRPVDPKGVRIGGGGGRVHVPQKMTMAQAQERIKSLPRNQRAAAQRALHQRVAMMEGERRQAQAETLSSMVRAIADNGGDMGALPKSAVASLDPKTQLQLWDFADKWRKNEQEQLFQQNQHMYWDLRLNPEKMAQYSEEEIMAESLSIGMNRAVELVNAKRRYEDDLSKGNTPGLSVEKSVINDIATLYEIEQGKSASTEDKRRYYALAENVRELAAEFQRQHGRRPTNKELFEEARVLTAKKITIGRRWILWDKKVEELKATDEELEMAEKLKAR